MSLSVLPIELFYMIYCAIQLLLVYAVKVHIKYPLQQFLGAHTALAELSLTLGVQVNMRVSEIVLDTTPLFICMYLQ